MKLIEIFGNVSLNPPWPPLRAFRWFWPGWLFVLVHQVRWWAAGGRTRRRRIPRGKMKIFPSLISVFFVLLFCCFVVCGRSSFEKTTSYLPLDATPPEPSVCCRDTPALSPTLKAFDPPRSAVFPTGRDVGLRSGQVAASAAQHIPKKNKYVNNVLWSLSFTNFNWKGKWKEWILKVAADKVS